MVHAYEQHAERQQSTRLCGYGDARHVNSHNQVRRTQAHRQEGNGHAIACIPGGCMLCTYSAVIDFSTYGEHAEKVTFSAIQKVIARSFSATNEHTGDLIAHDETTYHALHAGA